MTMKFNAKDVLGGLLLIAVGTFFFIGALDLPMGNMRRPGAGVFPLGLGLIVVITGLIVAARSVLRTAELPHVHWRPAIAVAIAIASFYFVFLAAGLIPATAITVILASAGDRNFSPVRVLAVAVGVSIASWLIFRVGLELPMPAIRGVF